MQPYRSEEGDSVTSHDGSLGLGVKGQLGEGLDGELGVALRAAGDELGGQGENLVVGEGSIERLSEGDLLVAGADVRGVTGLDGEDGASGGEVGLARDVGGSAEVGRDTDTLEDRGSGEEGLDAVVAELVLALSDGLSTGLLESRGQEIDVSLLVRANALDVVVESLVEASVLKSLLVVLLETLAVEGVLKVLKSQSIVQDGGIINLGSTLGGSSVGQASGEDGSGNLGEMHYD